MKHRRQHLALVSDPLPAHASESLEDRAREDRIVKLQAEYVLAANAGAVPACVALFEKIRAEVMARSPAQVARMERARGLCTR